MMLRSVNCVAVFHEMQMVLRSVNCAAACHEMKVFFMDCR